MTNLNRNAGHAVKPFLNAVAGLLASWTCKTCGSPIRWLSPRSLVAVHVRIK